MAKGRNRKKGKREPNGRLSRAENRVKPSEWVQRQQIRFGNHYTHALGRAYRSGLLGEGAEAKIRLDAGNKFVLRYSKIIGGDAYSSPLGDRSGSNDNLEDYARDKHQFDWLMDAITDLERAGLRPWLDQLISKLYVDNGPKWLDALLDKRWNENTGKWREGKPTGHKADLRVLEAAIAALDLLAGTKSDSIENKVVDMPLHMCHGVINA